MTMPTTHDITAFLDELYARGTLVGRTGTEFKVYPTGLVREKGDELCALVAAERPETTIETGFAYGLSSLFICRGLMEAGREGFRHLAMDPLQKRLFDDVGLDNFERAGLADRLEFHENCSGYVLPRLVEEGRRFDFAFVDGDHRFESVFIDLYFMFRLVKPGGLIVVDDMWMPSVRAAVDYWVRNLGILHENRRVSGLRRRLYGLTRFLPLSPGGFPDPGLKTDQASMALLRLRQTPRERMWDDFVPFTYDY
jgi:predicted O-methyltransferase YrrM